MEIAKLARALPIGERAPNLSGRRRSLRRRLVEREIPLTLVPTADVRDEPGSVGHTEEWEALGAEALCMLHLSPTEMSAAVDHDLSTSASWLLHALGHAMDQR